MRKAVVLLVLFALAVSAAPLKDKSYVVNLHYSEGGFTKASVDVQQGYAPDRLMQEQTGFMLVLKDNLGSELYRSYFTVKAEVEAPMRQDGYWGAWVPIDDFDHVVLIPYFTEGKTIELFDAAGRKMRTLDVSSFAQCDQNRVCSGREKYGLCSDCLPGEKGPVQEWLDGDPVDSIEATAENLPEKSRSDLESGLLGGLDLGDFSLSNLVGKGANAAKSYWWLIVLIIIAVVLIMWRRKKK